MRKLIVSTLVTLDGVVQDPGGFGETAQGGWASPYFTEDAAQARQIDLEDAQTIIAAIKGTPEDIPIDFVIHTPGGLVLAAMQIARAVEAHKAKVTVYVPVYAMSGGTLIALAADEIVLGEFSVLGPIDPQIAGLPAASIVKARD